MDWSSVIAVLISTAAGALLAGLGTWFTQKQQHRLALQRLEHEHREERESELRHRGRDIADAVIESLLTVRDLIPDVGWMQAEPGQEERYDAEVRNVQKQLLLLPDRHVRERLTVALDVLAWPEEVWQWGGESYGSPYSVARAACDEAIEAVAAYLRGEDSEVSTDRLQELLRAQMQTLQEKHWQWEEEEKARRRG